MKKWLYIAGLVLGGGNAALQAEVVTPEQAEAYAMRRFESASVTLKAVRYAEQDGQVSDPLFYIFSLGANKGYGLIAAEDRVAPVLGYVSSGSYDEGRLPLGLQGLLASYERQIEQIRKAGIGDAHPDWAVSRPVVERVLQTAQWGQGHPYNAETPCVQGIQTPVGSVPAAAAVVMKYHEYPLSLLFGRTSHQGKRVDWGGFDWMRMPNGQPTGEAEVKAVSSLMWLVGAQAEAAYDTATTVVPLSRVWRVLQDDFEYGTTNHYVRSADWVPDRWFGLIREEIDANSPVLYEGGATLNEQTVVCDGYSSEGLYHINWCENGLGNGFFRLRVSDEGLSASWLGDQAMVVGLQPAWPWLTVTDRHADIVDSVPEEDLLATTAEDESDVVEIVKEGNGYVTLLLHRRERVVIQSLTGMTGFDSFLEPGKHRIKMPKSPYAVYYVSWTKYIVL